MFIKNGSFKKCTHIISYVPPSIIQEPLSGISKPNETFEFKIKVSGSKTLEYKWYKNNLPIRNSDSDTLVLSNVQYSDEARYFCRVKNNRYEIQSNVVELSVLTFPGIISQPNNVYTELYTNISFNVSVTGSPVLNYMWYKDGSLYHQGSNYLYINNISKEDEGYYYVTISNDTGSTTSTHVVLSVFNVLDIYKNPTYFVANKNSTANFNLNYTGLTPITAQWLRNDVFYGEPIINSTGRVDLNLTNVSLSDSAFYSCVVSNLTNSVTSTKALLYVNSSVGIISQPLSSTKLAGESVTFNVTVTGTSPISYKWYKNTIELPNSNVKTYLLQNVKQNDGGAYYCIISNLVNSVTTNFVNLSVIPNISFVSNLYSTTATINQSLTLSVNVTGSLPIYYTWRKNNINLPWSQTNNYYYIDTVDNSDAGNYTVIASNETGSITSFNAQVTVVP